MVSDYPWYVEVVDGSLDQGDILPDCPAGYLPTNWDPHAKDQNFQVDEFDLIVLTQACDLAHNKTEYVVCCPVFPDSFVDAEHATQGAKYAVTQKENIRQGLVPGYVMIAAHSGQLVCSISVVSFRQVFSLPKTFLSKKAVAPHLRLLPPYREHISQSFARFFMRVGLPTAIPPFKT